jgi:hypothetical protein
MPRPKKGIEKVSVELQDEDTVKNDDVVLATKGSYLIKSSQGKYYVETSNRVLVQAVSNLDEAKKLLRNLNR